MKIFKITLYVFLLFLLFISITILYFFQNKIDRAFLIVNTFGYQSQEDILDNNFFNKYIESIDSDEIVETVDKYIKENEKKFDISFKDNSFYLTYNRFEDNSGINILSQIDKIFLKSYVGDNSNYTFLINPENHLKNTKVNDFNINYSVIEKSLKANIKVDKLDYKEFFREILLNKAKVNNEYIIEIKSSDIIKSKEFLLNKYISNLDKEKLKLKVEENLGEKKYLSDLKFKDNKFILSYGNKKPFTESKMLDLFNSVLIHEIKNRKDFNYDFIIKSNKYELNSSGGLIISKKDSYGDNMYYTTKLKEFKNITKVDYADVLKKMIVGDESYKIDRVVGIDINKLEKSYFPALLKKMKIITYRTRNGYKNDNYYRRFNIKKIYDTIEDNLFIFNPGDKFSFNDIYHKGNNGYKYMEGYALIGGEEKKIYGGGVCGAATGFYQGTFLNSGLDISTINHTTWYSNLYRATINGEYIKTPGLDSTYFGSLLNLKMTNKSKYPIWMINKIENNKEINFTVSFDFNDINKKDYSFKYRKGNCFFWDIGGEERRSCYIYIK